MNDKPGLSPALLRIMYIAAALSACIMIPIGVALYRALAPVMAAHAGLIGALVLAFVCLAALGGVRILFAYGRKAAAIARQAEYIPLQNGQPAHIDDISRYTAQLIRHMLDRHYDNEAIRAEQQRFPASLHSLSYHDSHRALPLPAREAIEVLPEPPSSIPTFGELLDQGLIGPGRPLILGYSAETSLAITGSWRDLYSCGVGALQGAGKSWLCAFLLCQSAAAGGRLIICDPHAGSDESLSNRIAALSPAFMCNVATTDDEILNALRVANDKLERRRAGAAGSWPIVVMVDEWSSLLRGRLGAELPALVQNITEQGRKYHVNALLSAQGWTVDAAGIVRNRLTAHYVLRQRDQEARYQLGLRAAQLPDDIRALPDAVGYLLTVRGDLTKVIIPRTTESDIARAAALISRETPTRPIGFQVPTAPLPAITAEAGRKPLGSASVEAASTAAATARIVSPEALRAAALFRAKMSEKAIVKELRGIDGGRKYEAARKEVRELILAGLSAEKEQP